MLLSTLFYVFLTLLSAVSSNLAKPLQKRVNLIPRVTARVNQLTQLGGRMGSATVGLVEAAATGQDPTPYIDEIQAALTDSTSVIVDLPPPDGSDQEEVITLAVNIVVEIVLAFAKFPLLDLSVLTQLTGVDLVTSQFLNALDQGSPGTSGAIGQAFPPADYPPLLNLNLVLTVNALGLDNILSGIGL